MSTEAANVRVAWIYECQDGGERYWGILYGRKEKGTEIIGAEGSSYEWWGFLWQISWGRVW